MPPPIFQMETAKCTALGSKMNLFYLIKNKIRSEQSPENLCCGNCIEDRIKPYHFKDIAIFFELLNHSQSRIM